MTKNEIKAITGKYFIGLGFVKERDWYNYVCEKFYVSILFKHSPYEQSYEICIELCIPDIRSDIGYYGGIGTPCLNNGTYIKEFFYSNLTKEKYLTYLNEIYEANIKPFFEQGEKYVKHLVKVFTNMRETKIKPEKEFYMYHIHPRAIEEIEKW